MAFCITRKTFSAAFFLDSVISFFRNSSTTDFASIQKLGKIANVSSDELQLLHSYFPNVNIEKIENVQSFHFLPKAQKTNFHCNRRSRQMQRDF